MVIDYSQYSLFHFCPWAWYERYVNQRQRPWNGQRSDPLCLGSLVHNAMDNFTKTGRPIIDQVCIEENCPTPDTLELVYLLVNGYLKRYPSEKWPVELAEQPLQFPIHTGEGVWACPSCGEIGTIAFDNPPVLCPQCTTKVTLSVGQDPIFGMAKLDGYFYVPEDTTIESGIMGHTLTLERGWWSKEFKTKKHGDRGNWIKEWQTKMQATFQILALKQMIESQPRYHVDDITVRGVLVCVMEKPHDYIPKRKCEKCKENYELAAFIPKADGYMCPMCGCVQNVTPYKPKVPKVPDFFRIIATRTPTQLKTAKAEIFETARMMETMRNIGMECVLPNREACVINRHFRECEYMAPHTYGGSTSDAGMGFVTINAMKYMGITV